MSSVYRISSLFFKHEKANVARANSAGSNALAYALHFTQKQQGNHKSIQEEN